MLLKLKRSFCKMIKLKPFLILTFMAILFHVTFIFIPSRNLTKTQIGKADPIEERDYNLELIVQTQNKTDFSDDFEPRCKITNKDAVSAIRRAKTQYCKQKIANITCLIQNGNYFPKILPHSCPNNEMKYGRYLGCYADKYNPRILPDYKTIYGDTNSKEICLDKCVLAGYPYAGVQYSSECFCGNDKPPKSSLLRDNACDMPCSGAPNETCGGSLTMNVFETGIAEFVLKQQLIPSMTDKESVRIVFFLMLNGRALRQIHRLINALYRTRHYFYIHIDARQHYLYRKLSVLEKKFGNIKLATKRFSTIWGGSSFVTMFISSMKELSTFGWKWDFVMNLSECDFPIKSLESLENFLSVNKGHNFLESSGRKRNLDEWMKNQGSLKTFIECEGHMWLIGDKTFPKRMVIDGGSDWFTLSERFVSFVISPKDKFLFKLERVYNHTIFAFESYFHTVLRNTRFCNTRIDNNLHIINWNRTLGCKCQYRQMVDWCGCSPMVFKVGDLNKIEPKDDHRYFARKFEPIISNKIINKIERMIGMDDHDSIDNLDAYWENIFDIEDNASSKDDLFISHAKSITRIHANKINHIGCNYVLGEVREINLYNKADVYQGNLVLHEANFEGKRIILETFYKPKQIDLRPNIQYFDRIKMFKVSSQYDQKEQIFRNFADILGPYTEPVLVYDISPNLENKTDYFNIYWSDPTGKIAKINKIHVDNKNYTNFINSNLSSPILPGIWKVELFQNYTLIIRTQFLITPLEYLSRKELSLEEAAEINGGSEYSYPQISKNDFLANNNFTKKNIQKNFPFTTKTNDDLRRRIDKLSIRYYDVIKSCVSQTSDIKVPMRCGGSVINVCELTKWSSLSPDLKSNIGELNNETGKLKRDLHIFDKTT